MKLSGSNYGMPTLPIEAALALHAELRFGIPGEPDTQSDFAAQFRALRALGYRSYVVPEMSVHVQRRPNYDQYESLRLAHRALTDVLRDTDGRA